MLNHVLLPHDYLADHLRQMLPDEYLHTNTEYPFAEDLAVEIHNLPLQATTPLRLLSPLLHQDFHHMGFCLTRYSAFHARAGSTLVRLHG